MYKLFISLLVLCSVLFGKESINRQYDLRQRTSLSAEDLNNHLGGVLKGKGEIFKQVEEKYNVNALFLVAVASLESGNGTSARARNKFNCFGLKGKSFKSIDECIDYTAMILSSPTGYYYGRNKFTIEKVGKTYAPPHHSAGNKRWISWVISIMQKIQKSAEKHDIIIKENG